MKPRIKIAFTDFWEGFEPKRSLFYELLSQRYRLELSDTPDFLVYSSFGKRHLQHRGIRIFYTGENVRPDFTVCDYAFTFDHLDHPRHYRLPLYVLECDPEQLRKPDCDPQQVLRQKTGFCCFVYGNPRGAERNRFFRKLSKYKRVDAGGRLFHNMDRVYGDAKSKLQLIANYKFTFAFENSAYPGYTTEKIIHPMLADSVPIYWGNPLIHLEFNRRSFVNYHDFAADDDVIDRIVELDRNDDLYLEMVREPWFPGNEPTQYFDMSTLLRRFEQIFTCKETPVAVVGQHQFVNRIKRWRHKLNRNAWRLRRDVKHMLASISQAGG